MGVGLGAGIIATALSHEIGARTWVTAAAGVSTLNIAPCGSISTAERPTVGMSNGSTATCPPAELACAAVASASGTAKYTCQ